MAAGTGNGSRDLGGRGMGEGRKARTFLRMSLKKYRNYVSLNSYMCTTHLLNFFAIHVIPSVFHPFFTIWEPLYVGPVR